MKNAIILTGDKSESQQQSTQSPYVYTMNSYILLLFHALSTYPSTRFSESLIQCIRAFQIHWNNVILFIYLYLF